MENVHFLKWDFFNFHFPSFQSFWGTSHKFPVNPNAKAEGEISKWNYDSEKALRKQATLALVNTSRGQKTRYVVR